MIAMNPAPPVRTDSKRARQRLKRLIALGGHARALFASPVRVRADRLPDHWIPRFSVFGMGRRDHPQLIALLSGLRPSDEASQLLTTELLDRLAAAPNPRFPDMIAYFNVFGPLAVGDAIDPSLGNLLDADWSREGDPRIDALTEEFVRYGFDAVVSIVTDRGAERPTLRLDGIHADAFAPREPETGWTIEPLEARAGSGPLSLGKKLAHRPASIEARLPDAYLSEYALSKLAQGLEAALSGYAAYLARAADI